MAEMDEGSQPTQFVDLRSPLDMGQEAPLMLNMAEALVLSHCLDRVDKFIDESGLLDIAERTALWGLINLLEQNNPVIFSDQYDFYIRQAKSFLIGSEEDV